MKSKLKKLVVWNSPATTKTALFEQIAEIIAQQGLITSPVELTTALNRREVAGSTMINTLLAAPHAQTDVLEQNVVIFVRTQSPILRWDKASGAQNFIFCCIRKDIDQADAHAMTQILQRAVKPDMQVAFQEENRIQILKKLNFTE